MMRMRFTALAAAAFMSACAGLTDFAATEEEAVIISPVLVESPAEAAALVKKPSRKSNRLPRKGVLTAGDVDDTLNLAAFMRYQQRAGKELKLPGSDLSRPMLARFVNADGQPQAGVRLNLRKPGAAEPFFVGYSGVDGLVSVFPAALGAGRLSNVELRAFPQNTAPVTQQVQSGTRRHFVNVGQTDGWAPDFLDLGFVVDTTGSMGDEMDWLQKELSSIVRQAKRAAPGVDIRFGLVSYKSRDDVYSVRNFGFTKQQSTFRKWIRGEEPIGGAGSAEYVSRALKSAVAMNWRRGRGERLLFQIGDEPPERDQTKTYLSAVRTAVGKGIQIYSVAASGVDPHLEYLMRQGAAVTNGRYLFLTDDSGVGYGHAEPTVSCYQVTRLNDLMVRVLKSELSGKRVEAPAGDVIRQVGTYQRGICRN